MGCAGRRREGVHPLRLCRGRLEWPYPLAAAGRTLAEQNAARRAGALAGCQNALSGWSEGAKGNRRLLAGHRSRRPAAACRAGHKLRKISLVPEYTALQELGRSEDGCWMLTLYGRWHGWVSMDHLEK